ncbi:MAG: exo-alpha-sialidase [Candidatus Latescibacterota bacterium]|nr:exo-alpha-sialidase [Candidatus Latescibacterota bacterium]MEE2728831.1 exo-alpha-sialidase [Candidatus Latescibacterota bacterium]
MELLDVRKIWDEAPHNAFTDLVHFGGRFFCVFREGEGHVSPDGALRVIASFDGVNWASAALITSDHSDLRDAKITVMPENQLMLCGAEALHDRSVQTHQSLAWFSDDGARWSERVEIGDPDIWLWRATWHRGMAYGMGYGCGQDNRRLRFYHSEDGRQFRALGDYFAGGDYANETSIVFVGDTAHCLLRRDGEGATAMIGTAEPPYSHWSWKDLGVYLGGPHMLLLPDGRLIGAVRIRFGADDQRRTVLGIIDPQVGSFREVLALPSGGDTSYAGMVLHDDRLWVSYYSSHEEKTSIYLATVAF